jgi:hypothetical protein
VNLETLRRLARWSEKIAKAQGDLSAELLTELAEAEAAHDPLAVHIYQARADYRKTQAGDKSKHGRRIALTLWTSYQKAGELGFTGPREMWELLMKCGVPSDHL